jgi:hypothetical protein
MRTCLFYCLGWLVGGVTVAALGHQTALGSFENMLGRLPGPGQMSWWRLITYTGLLASGVGLAASLWFPFRSKPEHTETMDEDAGPTDFSRFP